MIKRASRASASVRKPRRPSLATVAKQAIRAGIDVSRYEVKPDGTVTLVVGKPEATEPNGAWDKALGLKK
jgi:hypothetical protein